MRRGSFDELLAMPGVVEECVLRGRFGFMAFHGGGLEATTDVIARAAAERAGASYYGVTQPDGDPLHVPSISVQPKHSDRLATFLEHVSVVVTVHGYGREGMWTTILLGGRNRDLAAHVAAHIGPALPDYDVVAEIDAIPLELRGVHDDNPVNAPRFAGVQIELPPRVRGAGRFWEDWTDGLVPHTHSLIDALVLAAGSFDIESFDIS